MATYKIYHATSESMFTQKQDQPRKLVGEIEASNLDDAYFKTQNWETPWNMATPCRSTSVGDVIESDEGFYMVCGMGFKLLDEMSKNDSELNALENQSPEA
jgi:hypothetical protein